MFLEGLSGGFRSGVVVQWLGPYASSAVLGERNVGKLGRPAVEVASIELYRKMTKPCSMAAAVRERRVAASKGLDEP